MRFEIYRDEHEEWRWRIVATNGNILADGSEGYARKIDCMRGIELVRTESAAAEIRVEGGA